MLITYICLLGVGQTTPIAVDGKINFYNIYFFLTSLKEKYNSVGAHKGDCLYLKYPTSFLQHTIF